MIKKTISNDLSLIDGTSNAFFTGFEDQTNRYLDPYITGYAFIYWVQLPSWFEQDDDLKYFKTLSQKNFRSFNGINGIDLSSSTNNSGFAAREISVAAAINSGNTEFQISHNEYSGGVMTKLYQKWVTMIRDPRTGIALYPKLYDVEYSSRNHTGQLLYIVTRPDVTNTGHNNVEWACFYSSVYPTNVPLDTLYNYEMGNQDTPSVDITFKGFPEFGPNVTEYAKKILANNIMSTDGDSYMPFVDSYNTNTDASETVDWGTTALKEIYQDTESN